MRVNLPEQVGREPMLHLLLGVFLMLGAFLGLWLLTAVINLVRALFAVAGS